MGNLWRTKCIAIVTKSKNISAYHIKAPFNRWNLCIFLQAEKFPRAYYFNFNRVQ